MRWTPAGARGMLFAMASRDPDSEGFLELWPTLMLRQRLPGAEKANPLLAQEIQRLVGRSLRAVADLKAMGERQVRIDCDVIQADGGTRTAAITGSYVALHLAFQGLVKAGKLTSVPLVDQVAAISCGLYEGMAVLDLDYAEDSNAQADANFVLTASGGIVEVQGTAEERPFSREQFETLLRLAEKGVGELTLLQKAALGLA